MKNTLVGKLFHPEFPFKPRRFPFFYGWMIVLVTTIGVMMSVPGQTMGVSVFTEFLIKTTGLSRLQLSLTYMVGTIFSGFIVTVSGKLIDRFGTRLMIVGASLGLGGSLLILSFTEPLLQFLRGHLPGISMTVIGFVVMIGIFLCIRYFGQGIMTMVSRVTLSKWFDKRRGFATGVSGVLVSMSFSGSPLVLNLMITHQGWVQSAFTLALVCGFGMAVLGWFFYRDNPEECGLKMDGVVISKKQASPEIENPELAVTLKEAVKTYNFWVFTLGLCSYSLIVTGIVFHISSIGALNGLNRMESFSIFLPMSIFSLVTHFLSGWISDRISLKYLLMIMMVATGMGLFGFLNFGSLWARIVVMINFGIMGGLFGCLSVVTWPRFYGRKHLGAISGLIMGCMVFASAIGPPIFGLAESLTGHYQSAFYICMWIAVGLLIASVKATSYLNR